MATFFIKFVICTTGGQCIYSPCTPKFVAVTLTVKFSFVFVVSSDYVPVGTGVCFGRTVHRLPAPLTLDK
jgi:hypothetical protein